jgi:ribosomal-protein-alanine N-acetyltransferase
VEQLISSQLKHWQEHRLGWWAVEPRFKKQLIGWCGLQFLPETEETEVSFLIGKLFWGQGFTRGSKGESASWIRKIGLRCIVGITHPENLASQRVLEKLGMSFTAKTRYFGMDCESFRCQRNLVS